MTIKRPSAPVSASELSKWNRCQRLWAADYMSTKWPAPERKVGQFTLGLKYHKVVEDYQNSGVMPLDPTHPITEMFVAALPYLPAPMSGVSERRFTTVWNGVPFEGTADHVTYDSKVITDHKTSKNPGRYGVLTREQKLADVQTVTYCSYYLEGKDSITFNHVYAVKHKAAIVMFEGAEYSKGASAFPKAVDSKVELSREELGNAFFPLVMEPAERLFEIRSKGRELDPDKMPFPKNSSACREYGGCPYYSRCFPGADFRAAGETVETETPGDFGAWLALQGK